jgi:hypothetical protein
LQDLPKLTQSGISCLKINNLATLLSKLSEKKQKQKTDKMLFAASGFQTLVHGCQMLYFQTKNSNLGSFWRALQFKMLVYIKDIYSLLRPFDIFYAHLVYFVLILYIFLCVGKLYQEKSGNPFLEGKMKTTSLRGTDLIATFYKRVFYACTAGNKKMM